MNKHLFWLTNNLRMIFLMLALGSLAMGIAYSTTAILPQSYPTSPQAATVSDTLCGIIAGISQVIGLLAIFMFILGGTLYGFAHFMPASGNLKGSMQGWGMGVLMGGIIMIILYALAPFIISNLLQFSISGSANVYVPTASGVNCAAYGPTGGGFI